MNYITLNTHDIANGTGFRVSLFVTGCRNKCEGCFNKETWDFNTGTPFTENTKSAILDALNTPETDGITLLGGEPLEPENQETILDLLQTIKTTLPEKTVWLYTGRTINLHNGNIHVSSNFMENDIANTPILHKILSLCDVVIDGPFIQELKSTTMFRGSSNQRIIDMQKTLKENKIILWNPTEPEISIF